MEENSKRGCIFDLPWYNREKVANKVKSRSGRVILDKIEIMTKQDLIEKIAKNLDISENKAGDYLNSTIDEITKALTQGKDVVLTGFGTFRVTKRKARMGRNPQTGEKIRIPAKKVPKFKAGATLKRKVS